MSLVRGQHLSQAAIYVQILKDANIEVFQRDDPDQVSWGVGEIPQELLVRPEQKADALALLKEWQDAKPIFPDDLSDG